MISKLLNSEEAYCLWVAFGMAVGLDKLHDSYGLYWPRQSIEGEQVYEWREDGELIGWSAIRKDILEPAFWFMVGIFPEFKKNGLSKEIFYATNGFEVFKDVEWCWTAIYDRSFDFTKLYPDWIRIGEMNIPEPGYTIFGLKKELWRDLNRR